MSVQLPDRRLLWGRCRVAIARYRVAYWVVAVVAALSAALWVHGLEMRAGRAEAAWAGTRSVVRIVETVSPGRVLDDASTETIEVPVALVPEDALDTIEPGTVARIVLTPGAVVRAAAVIAPDALLPATHRGVAIPLAGQTPPLHVGGLVDLVGDTGLLTSDAAVVSLDEDQAVIAVPASEVATVTTAVRHGAVTIVLASV